MFLSVRHQVNLLSKAMDAMLGELVPLDVLSQPGPPQKSSTVKTPYHYLAAAQGQGRLAAEGVAASAGDRRGGAQTGALATQQQQTQQAHQTHQPDLSRSSLVGGGRQLGGPGTAEGRRGLEQEQQPEKPRARPKMIPLPPPFPETFGGM